MGRFRRWRFERGLDRRIHRYQRRRAEMRAIRERFADDPYAWVRSSPWRRGRVTVRRFLWGAWGIDWLLIAAAGALFLAGAEDAAMLLLAGTGFLALFLFPLALWTELR